MKRLIRRIGRYANTWLARVGLELRRLPPTAASERANQVDDTVDDTVYYPTVRSCQIPHISFLFELFLGRRDSGVFVEVGGYDGVTFSNTWGLAERGWDGLLIEPVPEFAEMSRANHQQHPGVRVLQLAAGRRQEAETELYLAGSLTTASLRQMLEYKEIAWARTSLTSQRIVVPSLPLDEILTEEGVAPGFDLLVVDVEGHEEAVFSGIDIGAWKPRMMIVELVDTHPDLLTSRASDHRLGKELAVAGYDVVYKDSINTVFVRGDIAEAAYTTQFAGQGSSPSRVA